MDNERIGQDLSTLRKYYKLTQDELADRLGVSRQAVSKWERGVALPDISQLLGISELYGVTVNDILNGDSCSRMSDRELQISQEKKQQRNIFVLGCGRWGTFIAWYLDQLGHAVTLYGREDSANMAKLRETGGNEYLKLNPRMRLTSDLSEALLADILVISVGAQHLNAVATDLAVLQLKKKTIVLCMKGMEITTGRRLTQVVDDTLDHTNVTAVWLGPGHVQEFYRGVPNCMVIDSKDELVKKELIQLFSSRLIRFYFGTDLIGNEIGAAAKNVVGVAAGLLDGLGMTTLKGALMARGTAEIGRLIAAMGGQKASVYGLCHLGDYEATVFSPFSQNRAFGEAFARSENYGKLAEGYFTVKALKNLGKNYGIELPICEAVYQILYEKKEPAAILDMLFARNLKNEFS